MTTLRLGVSAAMLLACGLGAREIHVATTGDDRNAGTSASPLKTIGAAAAQAQPGDTVTVHAGTYRERITPPRGGTSDAARIVYQAAPGETVEIKGSEIVRGWKPFGGAAGVWKAVVPNSVFGKYNPYKDKIEGDWFTDRGRPHHTGDVYLNGKSLWEMHLLERVLRPVPDERDPVASTYTWFAEVDEQNTYIYANFHDKDPNRETIEINVRDAVFYPDAPGRDHITVRGFRMRHAATQWAAPTAEQIALIGTHWSKGWIIENNVISDSRCSCITLGKERGTGHNVWIKNPAVDGATHYNEVIVRAIGIGWSREKIGSHIVRNNTISNCEQAGIAGSLGAVFSRIYNNHIHDVWHKRQFTGAEMGGIKLHGAIDVRIEGNRIHNTGRGLWMDWMAQGTRITRNLLYDNTTDDLFVEVNHGPFLVDNNVFLSPISVMDWSQGGAYAHNLMAGRIVAATELARSTPYHKPHSTALAGLSNIRGGDDRFYNNVFIAADAQDAYDAQRRRFSGYGLWVYDTREAPISAGGNVYFGKNARAYKREVATVIDRRVSVKLDNATLFPGFTAAELKGAKTVLVNTELLGKTRVSGLPWENPDGSPLAIDADFSGKPRNRAQPVPGPFENLPADGVRVWPIMEKQP